MTSITVNSAGAFSADEEHKTAEKALRLNTDPRCYGTFAEIGGGQEVARWFFRVGGAAGTVAKTMSAYDMLFSDAIYGKGSRYVSNDRIMAMLSHEYELLEQRLKASRGDRSCFFVFADTVSARNYEGSNECHGWLGLRFQTAPHGPSNDILLHVNLRDPTNLLQQQALGTLGVNMIHGAFYQRDSIDSLLQGFFDSLTLNRIEIDLVLLKGPEFVEAEPARVNLALLRHQLCRAIAFDSSTRPITPSELLHNRPVVLQRGTFLHAKEKFQQMMRESETMMREEIPSRDRLPLGLFELSINSARPDDTPDDQELVRRVGNLAEVGYPVLISNFVENFRLTEYLRRYTDQPIRFAVGVGTLVQVLRESFYFEVDGGLLAGIGKLVSQGVKVYAFPMTPHDFNKQLQLYPGADDFCRGPSVGPVTAENISFQGPERHLYAYLLESKLIVPMR
jgi:hypothetical protein